MNSRAAVLALVAPLALSACAQDYSTKVGHIDARQFGEANRQTFAAMIIDPDPHYATPLPTSAVHAAQAIARYDTDKVKQPERVQSTGEVGGGSGSSGSGSK